MKKTNSKVALGVSLLLVALLTIVVSVSGGCTAETTSKTTAVATTETIEETIEVRIAHDMGIADEIQVFLYEPFKERVEERSNGRIEVTIYPNSSLMDRTEWMQQLSAGTAEGFSGNVPGELTAYSTDFGVLSLPYFISSPDDFRKVTNSHLADTLMKELEPHNLVGLGWTNFTGAALFSKVPLYTPEDYKGLKIRVSRAPGESAMWSAMGASVHSIPFSEAYSAAAQGVVNAVATGVDSWAAESHFVEVCEYGTLRPVAFVTVGVVANKAWWDSLPEDMRTLMQEVWDEVTVEMSENAFNTTSSCIEDGKAVGGTWITPTTEQAARFREIGIGVWSEFADTISGVIMEEAIAMWE